MKFFKGKIGHISWKSHRKSRKLYRGSQGAEEKKDALYMCSYASKCDPRTCCTPVPVTHSFYSTCSMLSTWWVFLEAHGIDNSNRSLARCKYNFCIIDLDFGAHLGSPKFQRVTLRVYAEGEDEKMQDEEGVHEVEALQQKQPQNKKTSKSRTFLL